MLPPAPAFNPFLDSPERRQVAEQQAQWFRHQADRARERAEHQRGLGLRPEEIPHYVMTLAGVVLFDQLANIVADPDVMLSMVPLPGPRGPLVSRVLGRLSRYPQVADLRTGRAISFPDGNLQKVPKAQRVSWGANERAEFIREWHERGFAAPTSLP
jgi:hypothetical protein